MPAQVFPAFNSLLLSILTGVKTAPQYIYMGLNAGGQDVSADDGGNPPVLSGYARKKIAVSSLGVSGGTLIIPTQTWTFTATPYQPAANTWFIADSATSYNYYFSGPLNPGVVSSTLPIGANPGVVSLSVPTAAASSLLVYDVLKLGSSCANNLEYVNVSMVGTDSNGVTVLSVNRLQYAHPVNEAFTRDGSVRVYSIGWVEAVNAQLVLTTQTC